MGDDQFEQIEKRVAEEPHYTNGWSLEEIHAARMDRRELLWEVKRLRKLLDESPASLERKQ